MASKILMRRALQYVTVTKRRDVEYAEECQAYRRQGFRPHYCKHGVNLWTDYDAICGQCEDSYGTYELALMHAKSDLSEYDKRAQWLADMPHRESMPAELRGPLIDWVCEPIIRAI